jgi:predicted protein tyrosine phosphatase
MSSIIVCALADVYTVAAQEDPSHMATLINAHTPVERPVMIAPERHLKLHFNDIPAEIAGLTAPAADHVRQLIAFAESWDRRAPLLIHCYAGISRSTAAAYTTVLALNPERDEFELAAELRSKSPSATPNPRLIAFADTILQRSGRMIAAIEGIGRGADAFQGQPFRLDPFQLHP